MRSLRNVYGPLSRGSVDELLNAVAHDIEWNMPETVPWGGSHHGLDGMRALVEIFEDHVEGSWALPDDFLDAGDRIVVLGRSRGRARSSGQHFDVPFVHVWGMTDGVPVSFRGYFDTAAVMAALQGTQQTLP